MALFTMGRGIGILVGCPLTFPIASAKKTYSRDNAKPATTTNWTEWVAAIPTTAIRENQGNKDVAHNPKQNRLSYWESLNKKYKTR